MANDNEHSSDDDGNENNFDNSSSDSTNDDIKSDYGIIVWDDDGTLFK